MNRTIPKIFLLVLLLHGTRGSAQYILNGSAQKVSCNCYTLTPPQQTKSGSVWNSNKISLNSPFDFWFNVFLGCNDASGADGIVFILQPISTSVGSTGEGMGFGGVSPSIGIALDTYQNLNLNDPAYDHISIQKNGLINHSTDLAGPVPISAVSDNVEDCQWHRLEISWDPATQWLRAYFDGVLRVQTQVDLVGGIFNNDPNVYWGFTGGTGGSVNLQQFCTALDPDFNVNITTDHGCVNEPVQFLSQSVSFAPIVNYNWDYGDGQTDVSETPGPHVYTQAGAYQVHLKIKGLDGCEKDTVKKISIGDIPSAALAVTDTCFSKTPAVNLSTPGFGVQYSWVLDGAASPEKPSFSGLQPGAHEAWLVAASKYGCGSNDTARAGFLVKPVPQVSDTFTQQCLQFAFMGTQTDAQTTITQWNWSFGDQHTAQQQNPGHAYAQYGDYPVRLWALADNGCPSDTVIRQAHILSPQASAGRDTTVIQGVPAQLHGSGNGSFSWWPLNGLSDPAIPNPFVTVFDQQDYVLTVTTSQGCVGKDTIRVRAIKGPAVYVPDAFTPNGDGRNDLLRPVYVGMTSLQRFAVYNRWGQEVFATTDMRAGWDGTIRQRLQGAGTYVWIVEATDNQNTRVFLKGTVVLIR